MTFPITMFLFFLVEGHNTNANPQGPTRTTPQPTGRLDLGSLAPSVSRYFQNGLVPLIQKSYAAALKNFHQFCTTFNVTTSYTCYQTPSSAASLHTWPIRNWHHRQAPPTYLAAVHNMQISLGLPDPRDSSPFPILKIVQAGIKKARLGRGAIPKTRILLMEKVLEQVRMTLDHHLTYRKYSSGQWPALR